MRDKESRSRTDDLDAAPERRQEGDRRRGDRRSGKERRERNEAVSQERRSGKDRRRRGPEGERRKTERRINEYVLEPEVLEFINAVNDFKSRHQKPFPTWSDVYRIFLSLGYRKPSE